MSCSFELSIKGFIPSGSGSGFGLTCTIVSNSHKITKTRGYKTFSCST